MRRVGIWLLLVLGASLPCGARADDEPPAKTAAAPEVVATVGEEPIYAGQVADLLKRLSRHRRVAAGERPRLEAEILSQLIDERIALQYLKQREQTVSHHHVDAIVKEAKAKLEQQKTTLAKFLRERGMTEQALRTELTWRLSWQRYLQRRITDSTLQKYFDAHRKDFDGTRVRVSQILLKPPETDDPAALGALQVRAAKLREDILAGKHTFAAAAGKFSEAPTRAQGGDLGLISRHGEMVEPFAAAAFALKVNEISPTVTTRFGIHLIQCTEIRPGAKKWSDVADQLRSAIIQRGFQKIVQQQRPQVEIQFTGKGPHFDARTGKLVLPTPPRRAGSITDWPQ